MRIQGMSIALNRILPCNIALPEVFKVCRYIDVIILGCFFVKKNRQHCYLIRSCDHRRRISCDPYMWLRKKVNLNAQDHQWSQMIWYGAGRAGIQGGGNASALVCCF